MVLHEIYSYDDVADAIFVSMPVDYEYEGVMKVADGVFLEYDVDKKPKAIEIINASRKFEMDKDDLIDFNKLRLEFVVDKNMIDVKVNIELKNRKEISLNQQIYNNCGLSNCREHIFLQKR